MKVHSFSSIEQKDYFYDIEEIMVAVRIVCCYLLKDKIVMVSGVESRDKTYIQQFLHLTYNKKYT